MSLTRDVQAVGDEFGAVELAHLGLAIARRPPLATERVPESLRRADRRGAPDRDEAHRLNPAREHQILLSREDSVCREAHRLLRRAALAVDGRAGHRLGQPCAEPAGAGDVGGLGPDLIDAPPDDVVDCGRIDACGLDGGPHDVGGQVGRVDSGEAPSSTAHGGANGADDVCLGHDSTKARSVAGREVR
jgi:hypothetical protein